MDRTEAELTRDFEDLEATIQCRYYDTTTTPGTFSIRDFTLDEVVIAGFDDYVRHPEFTYTSHNALYLLRPSASSLTSSVTYNCYNYADDENMYDPMSAAPSGVWPSTGSSEAQNIQAYTGNDHKCGATQLIDKYYKVIFEQSFPYDVVVDVWGDRCFLKNGAIWKLRYDEFGEANACVDPAQESHRVYLYYDFKSYNEQKINNKLLATRIPALKQSTFKGDTTPHIEYDSEGFEDDITCRDGETDAATILLQPRIGMCYDTTDDGGNPKNTWYNVCREDINTYDDLEDVIAKHARY